VLGARYTGTAGPLLHPTERCPRCLLAVPALGLDVSSAAAFAWAAHSWESSSESRPEVAIDIGVAGAVHASAGEPAGTAGLTVGAYRPVAELDIAEAAIEDSPGAVASASGGIVADRHAVGTHLAAVEEHTACTGRSHRPGAASCIADPWLKISGVSAITRSRYMNVAWRGERGVDV
jgi:hypothetical protein